MGQEFKSVGIVGGGAAGCLCAYFLVKSGISVTIFDHNPLLITLLPTGGGRCNLAHAEFDFKELAKNYPRGEKFLYSVFSKFSTCDTLSLFKDFGVDTYPQDDGKIFPVSNSAKEVRNAVLSHIKNANFIKETVVEINKIDSGFKLKTGCSDYFFTDIVLAHGGNKRTRLIKGINHNVIPQMPSLVGLNSHIKELSGIVLKSVYSRDCKIEDDLLFTHYGISGPLAYKISSIKAFDKYPYTLTFDLYKEGFNLQDILNSNSHKKFKNILSEFLPHRFCDYILGENKDIKACNVNGKLRDEILNKIHNFQLTILGTNAGEETVSAGGYDLDEINPKNMESKKYPHLFFAGECLNIDGFCGGFNLQNAWSTAFVASQGIINY
ncbi:aminoacetone oxidase family FAD-binding enzyme [bacterium]|nr:aminoacetone oxidase family FAD-binding enzyme [bacterium]